MLCVSNAGGTPSLWYCFSRLANLETTIVILLQVVLPVVSTKNKNESTFPRLRSIYFRRTSTAHRCCWTALSLSEAVGRSGSSPIRSLVAPTCPIDSLVATDTCRSPEDGTIISRMTLAGWLLPGTLFPSRTAWNRTGRDGTSKATTAFYTSLLIFQSAD